MKVNTNSWNKIRYTIYAPIYNVIRGVFDNSRAKSIANLNCKPGDKILIVGAGTGLDIPYLPKGVQITATDITPAMVTKINALATNLKLDVEAKVMDGQNLDFGNEHFDHVILHLLLAVIPNPKLCIQEVDRVTKIGGRVAVFDKFIKPNSTLSVWRKIGNGITTILFSDITRDIYSIISGTSFRVKSDTPMNFKGVFRVVLLHK